MDWRNKSFQQQRVFQAPGNTVFEAARAFATNSLGWQLADTADGFEATGYSFSHQATAKFRFEPAGGGTKVFVELLVQRASPLGFMLFDVGGYYNRQIRKWLDDIQWHVHKRLVSPTQPQSALVGTPTTPNPNRVATYLFNGCLLVILVIFALYLLATCIFAFLGLLTGHLYLLGRGGSLTVHGPWARAISGIILTIGVLLLWKILNMRKKVRDQKRFSI